MYKAKEQLKEDVDGLNIALEAKQQEVLLLKRGTHRQSSEALTTSRPVSRILRSRPSSIQDSPQHKNNPTPAPARSAAHHHHHHHLQHSHRSRPDPRRISFSAGLVRTPDVGSRSVLSSTAAAGISTKPKSALTSAMKKQPSLRMTSSQMIVTEHDKALEAASLVQRNDENKENSTQASASPSAYQKLVELSNTPQRLVAAEGGGKKRMSVMAMHA